MKRLKDKYTKDAKDKNNDQIRILFGVYSAQGTIVHVLDCVRNEKSTEKEMKQRHLNPAHLVNPNVNQ
jgi:hypothetical protein